MRAFSAAVVFCAVSALSGCGPLPPTPADASSPDAAVADAGTSQPDAGTQDAGTPDAGPVDAGPPKPDDPFADTVVSFDPGPGAGFGQDRMPQVVFGPPQGAGSGSGGLDVVSLGANGTIVVGFTDWYAADGPGTDLIVFENAFTGYAEPAQVSVSDDGTTWFDFPCSPDRDAGFVGCAGVAPVFSNSSNGISPTNPAVSGGDVFDLADVGLPRARFVRLHDIGQSRSSFAPSVGFDLDAVAAVHPVKPDGGAAR